MYIFFFIYLFLYIHNLSNLDIRQNFLAVILTRQWLPPARYHPRVCQIIFFVRSAECFLFSLLSIFKVFSIAKENFDNFLDALGNRFIAEGDYNVKHTQWSSSLVTARGKNLLKSITTNNLNYLTTYEPTYWPTDTNKIPDLLDFFITKNISPCDMSKSTLRRNSLLTIPPLQQQLVQQ